MTDDNYTFYDQQGRELSDEEVWESQAPLLISKKRALHELGDMSLNTLNRLLTEGRLPSVKIGDGRSAKVLIPYQAVQELVQQAYAEADRRREVRLAALIVPGSEPGRFPSHEEDPMGVAPAVLPRSW